MLKVFIVVGDTNLVLSAAICRRQCPYCLKTYDEITRTKFNHRNINRHMGQCQQAPLPVPEEARRHGH